jgi:hypothetical protein
MKTSQKLELYAGLILQPVCLFYLLLGLIYLGLNDNIGMIFFLWLFSLLITVGSYYHVKKASLFGFWMTFIGGGIAAFLSVLFCFLVLYSGASGLFLLAALIPLILSSAAVIFAVASLQTISKI